MTRVAVWGPGIDAGRWREGERKEKEDDEETTRWLS
jgi:hypothetical protein